MLLREESEAIRPMLRRMSRMVSIVHFDASHRSFISSKGCRELASLQPKQLVYAAAEGKYADDGSGGGNGLSYGLLAAVSLATAGVLALAPHTVSYARLTRNLLRIYCLCVSYCCCCCMSLFFINSLLPSAFHILQSVTACKGQL